MKEILDSLSTSLEKLYQGFVLRDLLGFVLPGSIFLLSIWCLMVPNGISPNCNNNSLGCVSDVLSKVNQNTITIVAFIGVSYLTALILQSVHYGLADLIYQKVTGNQFKLRIWYFMKGISKPFDKNEDAPDLSEIPSLLSIGALAPEKALQNLTSEKALTRFQESKAYSERISVLQIVIGNSVLAGFPLLFLLSKSLDLDWWWTILGATILLFGYVEHWRLFYVRNLRIEILIKVANAIKQEDTAPSKNENLPESTD